MTSIDDAIRLLQEIKELGGSVTTTLEKAKPVAKKAKKAVKKVKRAPSAYNQYMKKELARLKKKHPRSSHQVLFKRAAKSWKTRGKKK